MRRKVFYFLLFTLFAVSCMACNLSADTTKTSKKADNSLIEDGYDGVSPKTQLQAYSLKHTIS